ncbi:hypothetical protein L3Y34_014744 [Caenorhabditis briggsae]|uniref:Uncharacterized protein n=1 Tax=Caenorhabditis briggsae TaxID=6238 RepID=A0AAE9DRY9_CAEBR|nr:hypothetical protein L3Y34_014744 [Caenorhabditis briggsae]
MHFDFLSQYSLFFFFLFIQLHLKIWGKIVQRTLNSFNILVGFLGWKFNRKRTNNNNMGMMKSPLGSQFGLLNV